jgi:hypothetical protein
MEMPQGAMEGIVRGADKFFHKNRGFLGSWLSISPINLQYAYDGSDSIYAP